MEKNPNKKEDSSNLSSLQGLSSLFGLSSTDNQKKKPVLFTRSHSLFTNSKINDRLSKFPSFSIQRTPSNNLYNKRTESYSSSSSSLSRIPSFSMDNTTINNAGTENSDNNDNISCMKNDIKGFKQRLNAEKNRYKVQEKAYLRRMNNEFTDDYATKAINTRNSSVYNTDHEDDSVLDLARSSEFGEDFDEDIDYDDLDEAYYNQSDSSDVDFENKIDQIDSNIITDTHKRLFNSEYMDSNNFHELSKAKSAVGTRKSEGSPSSNYDVEKSSSSSAGTRQSLFTSDSKNIVRKASNGKLHGPLFRKGKPSSHCEEYDVEITYPTEISLLSSDPTNMKYQIDDSILFPIIKPLLKPELLDDDEFLERFEWQTMLGVVVNSDIVTSEKNKMMHKLNTTDANNVNFVNAHGGQSYLSNFFVTQYKENLWISLKAKKYDRGIREQQKILGYSRSLVDEIIDEIMSFKYNSNAIEDKFYQDLIDQGRLESAKDKLPDNLKIKLDRLIYYDVANVVDTLLHKYERCQQLWMTHEDMYIAKPIMKSKEFINRLEALISWKNIVSGLHSEKELLINWFKSDYYSKNYTNELVNGGNQKKNYSSSSSSSTSTASSSNNTMLSSASLKSGSKFKYNQDSLHVTSSSGVSSPVTNPIISNNNKLGNASTNFSGSRLNVNAHTNMHSPEKDQFIPGSMERSIPPSPKKENYLSPLIVGKPITDPYIDNLEDELSLAVFAENILAYKNIDEIFERKIFRVINSWSSKSTQTYVALKKVYEDMNLPSFLPTILALVRFPSNLIREIMLKRLEYAKAIRLLTLMSIDQTIQDFKTIIKIFCITKNNFITFIEGVSKIDCYNPQLDFFQSDQVLLKFTDYLIILYGKKLLDSSKTQYTFTTYKEPAYLEAQWRSLKNIGYFLDSGLVYKISRKFAFLVSTLVHRLVKYINHQLSYPVLQNRIKLVKWYTSTFDNFNTVRRQLNTLSNEFLSNVQNAMLLKLSLNKDYLMSKSIMSFFVQTNHSLLSINGVSNFKELLYSNKSVFLNDGQNPKNLSKQLPNKLRYHILLSEEMFALGDREILQIIQGFKLGSDLKRPDIEGFKSTGLRILKNKYSVTKSTPADGQAVKQSASEINDDELLDDHSPKILPGYFLIIPVLKDIKWPGIRKNITLQSNEIEVPRYVNVKHGNILLVAEGQALNLPGAKLNFINKLKHYYIEEFEQHMNEDEKISVSLLFDRLYRNDSLSDLPAINNDKFMKLIKILKWKKLCSFSHLQKELIRMSKYYNEMSFVLLEKSSKLKDNIVEFINRNENERGSCLEIINNLYYNIRDNSLSALQTVEPDKLRRFLELLIQMSIDWITVVVDECIPSSPKTFKSCVSALEFADLIFAKFNVLLLSNEQFDLLKTKVSGCLSLLISHFDIMGARSNKANQVLLSISKLQRKTILKEDTLESNKNIEMKEKISHLDQQLEQRLIERKEIGKVLDNARSENKILSYLASSSSKFSSKWQKGDYIGGGTFGSVYTATDLTRGIVMAVKEIKFPNFQSVSNIGKIIKDEMTVLEMLDHPNIVHYYGVEVHSDKVYLFMEYCDAGSLGSLLSHGRITDERLIQWYTFQMVEGLAYLHLKNIAHRDIKPDNILLNRLGVVKFVDFGAAKLIASSGRTRMTGIFGKENSSTSDTSADDNNNDLNEGGIAGTPMYMSPEIILGKRNNECLGAEDIWALGCCVLEMSTGRRPWAKLDNEYAIMFHIAGGNAPQLPGPQDLSEEGVAFLNRCFVVDPEERATAEELINDPWLEEIRNVQLGFEMASSASSEISDYI